VIRAGEAGKMRRQSVEKIPYAAIPRVVPVPRLTESEQALRLRRFDDWIRDRSSEILELDAAGFPRQLGKLLAGLGDFLKAGRIFFYSSASDATVRAGASVLESPERYEATWAWGPRVGLERPAPATAAIHLLALPGQGQSLREGRAQSGPGMSVATDTGLRGWQSVRSALYLPCVSSGNLRAFLVVEAGRSMPSWDTELVERAEFTARLLASGLDRLHLRTETEGSRAGGGRRAHLEKLGRVASAVAHDFNNVLTAILGYADLAELELDEKGGGHEELQEIRAAAHRAAGLVGQVLDFGRTPPSGESSIHLEETLAGLEGMIRQVVGEDVAARFDWECPERSGRVLLDPGRLAPVVLNLASNARDAMAGRGAGARFTLSTRRVALGPDLVDPACPRAQSGPLAGPPPGDYVRLTARDTGVGIVPGLVEMIFEPFFTTKALGAGTGLGLASTADLVRQARGGIRVETAAGEGAAFHLYFPIVEAPRVDGVERDAVADLVPAFRDRGSSGDDGSRSRV